MSNFDGHYKGGVIGAVVTVACVSLIGERDVLHLAAAGLSTLTFALFPDIDIKSTPSKLFYSAFLVYLGVLYYLKEFKLATISSMIAMLPQVTKHRGIFHSIAAAILIPSYPLYLTHIDRIDMRLAIILWASGVAGYLIHLMLDKKFKLI
jgi:membrane-bound metal-dependent hydrolase YbcI (DUF457 family)